MDESCGTGPRVAGNDVVEDLVECAECWDESDGSLRLLSSSSGADMAARRPKRAVSIFIHIELAETYAHVFINHFRSSARNKFCITKVISIAKIWNTLVERRQSLPLRL